ncbi:MAG TPA: CocE/NonD family hydrolase [Anaerolineae bacterium]|nr:CocE/NonD family hydrolase [Anaerolineae bacterium]
MTDRSLYAIDVQYNVRVPVRDGLELSANLFMPVSRRSRLPTATSDEKFPAILEMIPYRKDDWRYNADHQRGTYFAQRGYAFCRLDVRGTGSSPGVARDEYTPVETQDGYDAVEWLAAQAWCNGNVGMWGVSYGGFTAIQVALLQPPHLKAIIPMYATDDRYTDDVHYLGGCMVLSELAQYAISQIGMNALPPKPEYAGRDWAELWQARLAHTPPWLIEWLREPTDGPYWRSGSLAPNYNRITCAIFSIGGWMDGYTNPVLRMQTQCVNAPRKALIGNWVHSTPDSAYPGPNLDYLHEMDRFFEYWLKGIDNGVMDEPPLTIFRREYTPPEAFPARFNGAWHSASAYPIERTEFREWRLGDQTLTPSPSPFQREGRRGEGIDHYPHRPTLGTRASLCWGGGLAPNGLARDLRPDEALSLTYTSDPLDAPLDIIGFPVALLYLSSSAPVAHVVVRLTDVAPDGASALVSTGILNLTHRESHADPQPLVPGEVYPIRVELKATGYRYLPGHRIRLSIASAYWPVVWPSPYHADNYLHRGAAYPSRLSLPVVPPDSPALTPPHFKTTPPELITVGGGSDEPPVWQIVEDVIDQSVTVKVYGGDTSTLPDGTSLFESERIEMTAYHHDPAHVRLYNEIVYHLKEHGYDTRVQATGSIRSTETDFHVDIQLQVLLNGNLFFQKSWLESVPRRLT